MSAESSRILIVDDDEAMRYVKSRVLRGEVTQSPRRVLVEMRSPWPRRRNPI